MSDISDLPVPSKSEIGDLPAPPKQKPLGQKAMEGFVTPALEAVGTVAGGVLGGGGGTVLGPVGTAMGTVSGAGAGYAAGKKLGELGEEVLGYRQSPTAPQAVKQSLKDVLTGAQYEVGGQALGKALGAAYEGAKKIPEAYRTLRGFPYQESVGKLTQSAEDLAKSLMSKERTGGRELYGAQRQARLAAEKEAQAARTQAETARKGFGAPQDSSVTGGQLMSDIKNVSDKAWQQRKELAEQTYQSAWDATRAKQAAGDYWQTSPSGKDFFSKLENKIQTSDVTPVSSAEEKEIRTIISELQGKQVGEAKGFAYDPITGFMSTPSLPKFAPLDVKAVVEQLRKLREAANGFPEEGFKAISQKRAQAMSKALEESIAGWDKSLREADNLYKRMSERL